MFAAPFHLGDLPPRAGGADAYARTEHPTLRVFEAAVGELDGGRCLSFATGMAALTAVAAGLRRPGDRVVLPSDGYYTTRLLAADELARFGIAAEYVPTTEIEAFAAAGGLDGARLVLLETPSNPQLDVCDIAAVARAARAAGALLAVDNTTATPLGQRPLDLGAHLTVGSDTKALTGHSDLLLGHVSTSRRRPARPADGLARAQRQHARALRGVARAPLDEHPGPAAGPAGGQRRGGGRGAGRLAGGHRRALAVAVRRTPRSSWPPGRCCGPTGWSRPSWPRRGRRRPAAGRPPGCGRPPPASAACTAPSTGARSGAPTPSPPGFVRLSCGIEDTADLVADLAARARRARVSRRVRAPVSVNHTLRPT